MQKILNYNPYNRKYYKFLIDKFATLDNNMNEIANYFGLDFSNYIDKKTLWWSVKTDNTDSEIKVGDIVAVKNPKEDNFTSRSLYGITYSNKRVFIGNSRFKVISIENDKVGLAEYFIGIDNKKIKYYFEKAHIVRL